MCTLNFRSSFFLSHSVTRKSHSQSENKPSSLQLSPQFLHIWLCLPELQINIFIAHWANPSRGPTDMADSAYLKLNFFPIQQYFSWRSPISYKIIIPQPNALIISGSFPTTVTSHNQQRLLPSQMSSVSVSPVYEGISTFIQMLLISPDDIKVTILFFSPK